MRLHLVTNPETIQSKPSPRWLSPLLLIGFSVFPFVPTLWCGYVWDDNTLTQNSLILEPSGFIRIWTQPLANEKEEHYWPVVYTSFWAEAQWCGLRAWLSHLINVLIHAANVLLAWRLLLRLKVRGAWLASALFAVHPIHVESVAWIIERKDVLSTFFYLLSALLYVDFLRRSKEHSYLISISFFVCALLSKSIVVTLPLVLGLGLIGREGRWKWDPWFRLLPFFLLDGLTIFADFKIHHYFIKLTSAESIGSPVDRALIAARALWFYLGRVIWPAHFMGLYSRWELESSILGWVLFPTILAAAVAMLWLFRRGLGFQVLGGLAFFVLTLAPILGFIEHSYIRISFVAERFAYLASLGVFVAIAPVSVSVVRLSRSLSLSARLGCFLLLTLLSFLTWRRCELYRDDPTFFGAILKKNPSNWVAWNEVGNYEYQAGHVDRAMTHFLEALRLKPDSVNAMINYGNILAIKGQLDLAIAQYRKGAEIQPGTPAVWKNLAEALLLQGKLDEAEDAAQKSLQLQPDDPKSHNQLGIIRAKQGRWDDAVQEFLKALQFDPENEGVKRNLERARTRRSDDPNPRSAQPPIKPFR